MRILILGSTGMLGASLTPYLKICGYDVIEHGNTSVCEVSCDLTKLAETQSLIKSILPDVIINLVACTNVDQCEDDIHIAYELNIKVVENIVKSVGDNLNVYLIHISTDQVYDQQGVSTEKDIKLTNIYALTKYTSELIAKLIPSTIIRTNFFGPSLLAGKNSFSDWVLKNLRNKDVITVFSDIVVNPLSMATLSKLIGKVIQQRIQGVFNVGSSNPMSKADIAFEIADIYKLPKKTLSRGLSTDINLRAYRPKDMSMDCSRFENTFNIKLPNLKDEIKNMDRRFNIVAE